MTQIKDGGGTGNLASVNPKGRLMVRGTNVTQGLKACIDGDYYEQTTGIVTPVNAVEFFPLYLLNSDVNGRVIIIEKIFLDCWESTGGTGGGTLKFVINPVITGGTSSSVTNTRFDDSTLPQGSFLTNTTTMTGTIWWTGYLAVGASTSIDDGNMLIAPNNSFGIKLTPPTGNTSMNVSINIVFYYLDLTKVGEER